MDFSKYENKIPYLVRQKNLDSETRRNIDSQRLTEAERQQAYQTAMDEQNRKWQERRDARTDETSRLVGMFYSDCREDLGYSDILDDAGCSALEVYAWREGHSGGFNDVYYQLSNLTDLLEQLAGHFKKGGA